MAIKNPMKKKLTDLFQPASTAVTNADNTDYQARMNATAATGDWASYAANETLRNQKIDRLGLDYEKTNNSASIPGVSTAQSLVGNNMFQQATPYSAAELAKIYGLNIDADALESLYNRETDSKYDMYERDLSRAENSLYDQFSTLASQQQDQNYRAMGQSVMNGQNAGATFAQNALAQQALSASVSQPMEQVATDRINAGAKRAEEYATNATDAVDKTNQIKQALGILAAQLQANEVQNVASNTGAAAQILTTGLTTDGQKGVANIEQDTTIKKTEMENQTDKDVADIQGQFELQVQELKNQGALNESQAQSATTILNALVQTKDFSNMSDEELTALNDGMKALIGVDLGASFWKNAKAKVTTYNSGGGSYNSGTQKNDKELTIGQAADKYNGEMNKAVSEGNYTWFLGAATQAGYSADEIKAMWEDKTKGKTGRNTTTGEPRTEVGGTFITKEAYDALPRDERPRYTRTHDGRYLDRTAIYK